MSGYVQTIGWKMMATNDLKKLLIEEGLSQVELSKASGISEGTVNKVCNKRRSLAPTSMFKILKGMNDLAENPYSITDIFPSYKGDSDDDQED